MVHTQAVAFPEEEELMVQDVNLSISSLRAGAFHLGISCEQENNEFMLCKQELSDPRSCLEEGKRVTNCALNFFKSIKNTCYDEFKIYAHCLNNSSGDMKFSHCRKTQAVFDKCVKDNLDLERPEYGYFCRIKVHHTERELPEKKPVIYEDIPQKFDVKDIPPPNYGNRNIIF